MTLRSFVIELVENLNKVNLSPVTKSYAMWSLDNFLNDPHRVTLNLRQYGLATYSVEKIQVYEIVITDSKTGKGLPLWQSLAEFNDAKYFIYNDVYSDIYQEEDQVLNPILSVLSPFVDDPDISTFQHDNYPLSYHIKPIILRKGEYYEYTGISKMRRYRLYLYYLNFECARKQVILGISNARPLPGKNGKDKAFVALQIFKEDPNASYFETPDHIYQITKG